MYFYTGTYLQQIWHDSWYSIIIIIRIIINIHINKTFIAIGTRRLTDFYDTPRIH